MQALETGAFTPEKIAPLFMAVFGSRIFLSLNKEDGIPVTLVSLPTSNASSAFPKLTPFPSWHMHTYGNCKHIEQAAGLEVDSVGRLWVLDIGSDDCNTKLWIFDLSNNDQTVLIHDFPKNVYYLHDLVLDETPNGYFAYSTQMRNRDNSSSANTTPMNCVQFPLPHFVTDIEAMLMDNHGTMYAAFWKINYIISVNMHQPDQAQSFHKVEKMNSEWPFTFSLDWSGTFWMTFFNYTGKMPTYKLLKAAVGAKSYMSEPQKTVGPMC
ncbi:Hypothetical predicted protein [Cloeon dipterum]|uniref:Bee-milk protein n=1 Tax=Cloeon dipterum TaxID=197152 RepID=A0A8S1DH25_9INSE|nr:Hypothetical predicted protein [Cloeon dipterum]